MKGKSYLFNRIYVILFATFLLGTSGVFAQANEKSKNITTVNGKKYYMHKVAHAQSLFGISKIYGVSVDAIVAENPSAKKGIITGQELKIPAGNDVPVPQEKKKEEVVKAPEVTTPPVEEKKDAATSSSGTGEMDLLGMVNEGEPEKKKEKEFAQATFKSSRNINFHTTEVIPRGSMDIRISHRFAPLIGGSYSAFGIDGPANLMISAEYSYDGRTMVGLQRSFTDKVGDLFFKWKIFRQAKHGSPVNVTYFGAGYYTFVKDPYLGQPNKFYNLEMDRVSYVNQLLVSRKFAPWLSAQVGFAHVHYNMVGIANGLSKNDVMVATGIIRLKYTKRQAIIFEYGYRLDNEYGAVLPPGSKTKTLQYFDNMGFGWEIETGGHVFQIFVTNASGILDNQYLIKADGDYSTSGMRIGFNIMRIFHVGGKKG
ncbi:MAG: DUF5777 family beta-barrel protein [Bacteroidia bacterium]